MKYLLRLRRELKQLAEQRSVPFEELEVACLCKYCLGKAGAAVADPLVSAAIRRVLGVANLSLFDEELPFSNLIPDLESKGEAYFEGVINTGVFL